MVCVFLVFFFKQKTAYEMRISDWSSDVCSSDLGDRGNGASRLHHQSVDHLEGLGDRLTIEGSDDNVLELRPVQKASVIFLAEVRSEEHTSELQSLMRSSYAVFCLKKKTKKHINMHIMDTIEIHNKKEN